MVEQPPPSAFIVEFIVDDAQVIVTMCVRIFNLKRN